MARNRRMQPAAIRFGPALKACLLCLLIGGSAVGYVWEKDQISKLSEEINVRENRLEDLKAQNERQRQILAELRGPEYLQWQIKKLKLGLAMPEPSQVLWLPEPTGDVPKSAGDASKSADPQFVSNGSRGPGVP